jgi:hypothetical protein
MTGGSSFQRFPPIIEESPMSLTGKGFMIWQLPACEGGSPDAIAETAVMSGLTHVLIKIADGAYPVNVDEANNNDLLPPVVSALRAAGIQVWGWHYVYGYEPMREASQASQRVLELELDGYVIDAESEWKRSGKVSNATHFMQELRMALGNTPIALSSYRWPSLHPEFPWKEFLGSCDYCMPQVYYIKSNSPGEDLRRCVREYQAFKDCPPIIPTGPAFAEGNWKPDADSTLDFLATADNLGLPAVNFYSWDYARKRLPEVWDTIAGYRRGSGTTPRDLLARYFEALNLRNPDLMVPLYSTDATHITAARMIQGQEAIRGWYQNLFSRILPDASFSYDTNSGSGSARSFNWQATSQKKQVRNGQDTFGLRNGRIAYHYSFFTLT